jgi:hypothetical protein
MGSEGEHSAEQESKLKDFVSFSSAVRAYSDPNRRASREQANVPLKGAQKYGEQANDPEAKHRIKTLQVHYIEDRAQEPESEDPARPIFIEGATRIARTLKVEFLKRIEDPGETQTCRLQRA